MKTTIKLAAIILLWVIAIFGTFYSNGCFHDPCPCDDGCHCWTPEDDKTGD